LIKYRRKSRDSSDGMALCYGLDGVSTEVKECVELYLRSQYAFMAWCSAKKAHEQLYLYLLQQCGSRTRMFSAFNTKSRHWKRSLASPIHIIRSHLFFCLVLPFWRGFPTKILYVSLVSPSLATCPAHRSILTVGDLYKSESAHPHALLSLRSRYFPAEVFMAMRIRVVTLCGCVS